MLIGVDRRTSNFYTGSRDAGHPIEGVIFQRLVPLDKTFSQLVAYPSDDHYLYSFALMELSFDPISRIKRGIVYSGKVSSQPQRWDVVTLSQHRTSLELLTFQAAHIQSAYAGEKPPKQIWCAIGEKNQYSVGSIISVERLIDGRELVTIRLRGQYGLLPELKIDKMGPDQQSDLDSYLEKVVSGMHTSPPESVVDRCREAASCLLSIHLGIKGKDLKDLISAYESRQSVEKVPVSAATIINRLHSRGKASMQGQIELNLPSVTDKDAELAVLCLGTLIRDLGYGEWSVGV